MSAHALLLPRHALSLSRRANARDLGVDERWVCRECDGDGKDGLGEPNACTDCTGDGLDRCRHHNVAMDCDDCADDAFERQCRDEEREDRQDRMDWLLGRCPEWAVP